MTCMIILVLYNLNKRSVCINNFPTAFRRQVCIFLDQELSCGSSVSDSLYGATDGTEGPYDSIAQRTDSSTTTAINNNYRNSKCCHSNRPSIFILNKTTLKISYIKLIYFYFYFSQVPVDHSSNVMHIR
jgi:hypothetical protein